MDNTIEQRIINANSIFDNYYINSKALYMYCFSGVPCVDMVDDIAGCLTDPDFIDLLIDNPNRVVIIEDAENVIMDRRTNPQSSVSNLLNISDGLLADFLNVQLICTFNNSVTMIDNALMRKGRLIARYEFGKLSIAKAQQLSDHLGFDTLIKQPMTIAEITNLHEEVNQPQQMQVIGFRRAVIEN
ncbi:hypothetical protein [Paraflavitalea speifideaquila]|uniref:hypothetical protein n=1 Tax=Paraflavitalea speifideaquila TaxID=3076558 RepID=UPI0028EB475C|nr:hypothetical protein [Paraflavitalea speifideiaquila]